MRIPFSQLRFPTTPGHEWGVNARRVIHRRNEEVWLSLVPIGVPAIFMGLGIVISVLQAFVFSLLTMIYIGLALDEPH